LNWMNRVKKTASAVIVLAFGASPGAQSLSAPLDVSGQRISVPRLEGPPRISDFEDMTPHGVGLAMARAVGFTDRLPRDGVSISERTEVFLGYDEEALHAVFVCFDRAPTQIRSHLSGRDRVPDSDDTVAPARSRTRAS